MLRADALAEEVVVEGYDDDPDYEPYPRPSHEDRRYPSYGRAYPSPAPRPHVKAAVHHYEPTYDSGYGTDASRDDGLGRGYRTYSASSFDPVREFDPTYDRGAELVKWQEIVADSAAAEAALAAAAAAAAQHKRINELDSGSDTPEETTPRVSEATVRAPRRLKISLRARARVNPGLVVM